MEETWKLRRDIFNRNVLAVWYAPTILLYTGLSTICVVVLINSEPHVFMCNIFFVCLWKEHPVHTYTFWRPSCFLLYECVHVHSMVFLHLQMSGGGSFCFLRAGWSPLSAFVGFSTFNGFFFPLIPHPFPVSLYSLCEVECL